MENENFFAPALCSVEAVREFSTKLLETAAAFQTALHRISMANMVFSDSDYGILMEVYGIKTRAFVLHNEPASHVVGRLAFAQKDLLDLFDQASKIALGAGSLKVMRSIVVSVATFTISLGADREEIVEFLYGALCNDVVAFESGQVEAY